MLGVSDFCYKSCYTCEQYSYAENGLFVRMNLYAKGGRALKKWRFITLFLLVLVLMTACSKPKLDTPEDRLSKYVDLWTEAEFVEMYDGYISETTKEAYGKEEYVDRTLKLYEDLTITNVEVLFEKPEENKEAKDKQEYKVDDQVTFPIQIKMETIAGPIEFDKDVSLKFEEGKEEDEVGNWFVEWDPSFTLPELTKQDKVGISILPKERGEIYERNGQPLAINGKGYEIGIIPEKFDEENDTDNLAKLLGTTAEHISQQLNQSWVQPDYFVPLKKIAISQNEEYEDVFQVAGVTSKEVDMREYPYGQSVSHLIGYVGRVNAEELEEHKDEGYKETDFIGKRGLEQLLEKQLRGEDGIRIYIEKTEYNSEKITIAEKPAVNGETIKLTIDGELQKQTFAAMGGEPGTAAVIDPKTGETLVLTSSPAFDPTEFMIGISQTNYSKLTEDPNQPLINKFSATYAPGSAIKPLTAAIGMSKGTLKPDEGHNIEGKKWQKDSSWGDFNVTRLYTPPNPVDLKKALVYSDNIYFAMESLKIGRESFVDGLTNFGFGEDMPYSYPIRKSQISNDGKIISEGQLADTSFGQGQMLMNIVHLASSFAPIINDGTMFKPILFEDESKSEVWKDGLISPEHAKILRTDLREVITDGHAEAANIKEIKISGKTGTAELKSSQDTSGKENGFFVAYPTDEADYIIAMMIENVESKGGSGHVAEKVAKIMANKK